jgi:hypothetical protein
LVPWRWSDDQGAALYKRGTGNHYVSGPLIFIQNVKGVSYGEIVRIILPTGEERTGQVLDISKDIAVTQVYEGTSGIDKRRRGCGSPENPSGKSLDRDAGTDLQWHRKNAETEAPRSLKNQP